VAAALASRVGQLLRQKGLTVSVAESCTGGRLVDRITDVPGSSDYFLGGVISYSNAAKEDLLGVERAVLASKGAVSREVALQMASGVRRRLRTDIGVGVTGIAGPTGGSRAKPVGLVFIAVSSETNAICVKYVFNGSRSSIKRQSTEEAVRMLQDFILKNQ
jgi:PncC family amidohydrolase